MDLSVGGDLLHDPGDERAVPGACIEEALGREVVEGSRSAGSTAIARYPSLRASALTPVSNTATTGGGAARGYSTAGNDRRPTEGSGPPSPFAQAPSRTTWSAVTTIPRSPIPRTSSATAGPPRAVERTASRVIVRSSSA